MIQVFLLCLFFTVSEAVEVRVTVHGVFLCRGNPDAKATIKLMEADPFFDDLLISTTVNVGKEFKLTGKENEWWSVEPYLIIEHNCKGGSDTIRLDFGNIDRDVTVKFGTQDLANSSFKEDMQKKINES
ncbi:hypothetical protein GCK32_004128 [Trichostrongylus colubriformis]|uniref:Transthyretin-like family protein n=1 Tax=Trichostrongylus colubriformis TaxID=6319 RepID=A0AAN8ISF1_TRICO